MTETQSDQSSSSSDNSSIGGDASNRSERGELSSAAGSQETRSTQSTDGQKSEANMSVAPRSDANMSVAPKPDANMSAGPAAETGTLIGPTLDGGKSEAPKPEANQSEAPKPEPVDPAALTKEQIEQIGANSKTVEEFKTNLGLEGISDQALGNYLEARGFEIPTETQKDENAYEGPAIDSDPGGVPLTEHESGSRAALEAVEASRQSALGGLMGGLVALGGGDAQDIAIAAKAGQAAGDLSSIARPPVTREGPAAAEPLTDHGGEYRGK